MTDKLHFEAEFPRNEELRTFIGSDIVLSSPDDNPFELLPRHEREFTVPISHDYFSQYHGGLSPHPFARFSTRSVLQQAGACVLTANIAMDSHSVNFLIRNVNPHTVLHFPPRLPFGRFYIRGSMITGQKLEKLLPLLFKDTSIPPGVSIYPDGLSIVLPIIHFARVTKNRIDLSTLRNNRLELDERLGLEWNTSFTAQFDELVLGETPKIQVPNNVNGEVLVGMDNGATHTQSPFVDPGFGVTQQGLPIRTEFWHLTSRQTPNSSVHLQFFKA